LPEVETQSLKTPADLFHRWPAYIRIIREPWLGRPASNSSRVEDRPMRRIPHCRRISIAAASTLFDGPLCLVSIVAVTKYKYKVFFLAEVSQM